MTRDALLATAPAAPADTPCAHCRRTTAVPVAVGAVERASGPPHVLYACPDCAVRHGAGPTPDEGFGP
ncbi:hypothetical protein [Streptomyces sp. NPDC058953]|uniref:hypothetical protein n=1 Tax=unclassified Streptomyces TaxID=2593676 RepID=UPI0036AA677D